YARFALVASLVVIVAGLWVFGSRGKENLDIDFTGGSVAHLELTKEMPIDQVRSRVAEAGFDHAKIQALSDSITDVSHGQDVQGAAEVGLLERSRRFALRVKLKKGSDLEDFEKAIAGTFADVAGRRVIDLDVRRASKITARNDEFFGGVRFEGQLAEALPAREIAGQIAAAGLPKYQLGFFQADEETGAIKKAPENTPAISIFRLDVADVTPEALQEKLAGAFTVPNPFPEQISQIGSQVASEMAADALLAIILAMGFIIIYIWLRFGRIRYGFAAVVALSHDVLFTVGALAVGDYLGGTGIGKALLLGDFKINLPVIAALLTIVGYSLNDTIVVFDRIRENMRLKTKSDWEIVTGSINQTLSRTLLTSLTTLLVVVIMYVVGGPGIHSFAYVMIIGVLAGTYSSIFIASPMLLLKDVLRGKPIAKGGK
ncbi:MAG: protein translocase subunit SecF, partial [Planctomycetes bacterium]|nr:protein translocase subunit SecF [Planctomycetota bacterium]